MCKVIQKPLELKVNGKPLLMKLDTGAALPIISEREQHKCTNFFLHEAKLQKYKLYSNSGFSNSGEAGFLSGLCT